MTSISYSAKQNSIHDTIAMDQSKLQRTNGFQSFKEYLGLNKARIYNLQHRKKPAELVRKDLISAMKMPDHENLNREDYLQIIDPWREEWEKGVQVPVNSDALPQANIKSLDSCEKAVQPPLSTSPAQVNEELFKQEHSFKLPENLIRHENKSETSTNFYELDLHDICWLETVNTSDLSIKLSDNLMEDVVNELEQQCARNIKEQQMGIEYDDHIVCDVCQCPDAEDGNEMVFCENCNVCVHQACYGILEIPLGDWFCNFCRNMGSKKNAVCVLCTNVGGALKPTTNSKWCHVSCACWVPDAKFVNLSLLEPIDIKPIPSWHWNMICSLCNVKKGTPIKCSEKNCRAFYHVTCAFKQKLKMKILVNDDNVKLKSYCQRHSQEQPQANDNNNSTKEVDFISRTVSNAESPQKNINPQYEFWKYVEINKVYQEISKKYLSENETSTCIAKDCTVTAKVLQQIIDLIHNYWKLKRISNYGNSLIKPTFAQKFEEEMQVQHSKMIGFRYHLERLRTLTYMLCKRERVKVRWIATQKEIFENACKLFTGVDSTSKPEDDLQTSNMQPNVSNDELFMQILKHDNIYLAAATDEPCEQFAVVPNLDFIPPLTPSSVGPSDESITREDTPSIASSSLDGLSTRKQYETSSAKNMTNHILRQLKRLSRIVTVQTPKVCPNPYAKVYLNSATKRKPNELENGCVLEQDDSSLTLKANGEFYHETATILEPLQSKLSSIKRNHRSGKCENVSRAKRKLDLSVAGVSLFNSTRECTNDFTDQQPPKKSIKLEIVAESKPQVAPLNKFSKEATKRVYNFRKSISMDCSNGEEANSKLVHQKENDLCVNHSPKSLSRVSQRELNKLGLTSQMTPDQQQFGDVYSYSSNSPSTPQCERKSLRSTSNSENLKASVTSNCLSAEIKQRFRQFNHFNSSR